MRFTLVNMIIPTKFIAYYSTYYPHLFVLQIHDQHCVRHVVLNGSIHNEFSHSCLSMIWLSVICCFAVEFLFQWKQNNYLMSENVSNFSNFGVVWKKKLWKTLKNVLLYFHCCLWNDNYSQNIMTYISIYVTKAQHKNNKKHYIKGSNCCHGNSSSADGVSN